ncbi:uncharacterized protein ACB058_014031 [Synchiropus picturatus]
MPSRNNTHSNNMTMPPGNNTHSNNMTMPPGNNNQPNNTTKPPASQPADDKPVVNVEFKVQQDFKPEFANKSSPEFRSFASNITSAMNQLYAGTPGFNRSEVTELSRGSVVVKLRLIFNNASNPPNASNLRNTLVAAVSSGNFSLPVNVSSITATVVTPLTPTTVAPTTARAATANKPDTGATRKLEFSMNRTFVADLLNQSSTAFKELESEVVGVVSLFFMFPIGVYICFPLSS